MTMRKERGGTLALSIVCAIVIVMLGVGFYFLMRIIGGQRELQHATDAGNLNVAKQAIVRPNIVLDATNPYELVYLQYADTKTVPGKNVINLSVYNRLAAHTLLVALNAQADGSQKAIDNAKTLIKNLQEGDSSIAGRLAAALSITNGTKNPLINNFGDTANPNSLRMLGKDSKMTHQTDKFVVSYMQQKANDAGATNVLLDDNGYLPFTDYRIGSKISLPGNARTDFNGGKYMRGYQPIAIDGVGTLFGVPVQPGQQPHLVSAGDFDNAKTSPADGIAKLPPNAFRNWSQSHEAKSGAEAMATSSAIVGVTTSPFNGPSISSGYLIVDNSGSATFSGNVPSTDNVAANELGTGITVDTTSGMFSNNGAVEAWQATDRSGGFTPDQGPGIDGLYRADGGNVASKSEAASSIPYGGSAIVCTDMNSDTDGGTSACVNHMQPTGKAPRPDLGAFDRAYHPNGGYSVDNGNSGQTLTAEEFAKCEVYRIYGIPPFSAPQPFHLAAAPTGIRQYPENYNPLTGAILPWGPPGAGFNQVTTPASAFSDPSTMCKVTTNGNVVSLFKQTTAAVPYKRTETPSGTSTPTASQTVTTMPDDGQRAKDELTNFVTERLHQMKPKISQSEINNVLNQPIELGKIYYISVTADGNVIMKPQAPSVATLMVNKLGPSALIPDGKTYAFSKDYNAYGTIINTVHDANIHDHHFMKPFDPEGASAPATDTVSYTPSSGANLLLGVVKMRTQVQADLTLSNRN